MPIIKKKGEHSEVVPKLDRRVWSQKIDFRGQKGEEGNRKRSEGIGGGGEGEKEGKEWKGEGSGGKVKGEECRRREERKGGGEVGMRREEVGTWGRREGGWEGGSGRGERWLSAEEIHPRRPVCVQTIHRLEENKRGNRLFQGL